MTIGTSNSEGDDDKVTDAQLKADMAAYIQDNFSVGQYIKSKHIELDYEVCNRRIGKRLRDAFDLIDGMDITMWSEGNCNTWRIVVDSGNVEEGDGGE